MARAAERGVGLNKGGGGIDERSLLFAQRNFIK